MLVVVRSTILLLLRKNYRRNESYMYIYYICVPPVTTSQNKRVIQKKRKMWMMVRKMPIGRVMTMIRYYRRKIVVSMNLPVTSWNCPLSHRYIGMIHRSGTWIARAPFLPFCRDLGTTTMLQFSLVESGNESMHRLPISII